MILNHNEYVDKVRACWIGKNIGGTMGTPYEGTHEYLDVKGFVTKKGEVLPNDDLDLQLVWLHALEKIGPYNISASTLGEFWISYITPHWNEYGLGKNNMKRGLLPPLAGDYQNHWNNSNGAWIRTEIWACTTPGCPAAAAKYAIEDAKVDHGAGEGTFAAAFVAAMQSAAFVIKDIRRCIEVGLASVPESCRVAKSVKYVIEAYDKGVSHRECRDSVQQMNADLGDGWFEAPSNVAYTVIGLLYGEGDFKKSMIAAINCGDDTDCTAATLGATLGILNGMAGIPQDWMEYIGDDIITISIAKGNRARNLPNNCKELTERVVALAPSVIFANRIYTGTESNYTKFDDVKLTEVSEGDVNRIMEMARYVGEQFETLKPYMTRFENVCFAADVTVSPTPDITPGGEVKVGIRFQNILQENNPYNLTLRWLLPEGFTVEGGRRALILDEQNAHTSKCRYWGWGDFPTASVEFVIKAGDKVEAVNRAVLEVVAEGRPNIMYIPVTLLG